MSTDAWLVIASVTGVIVAVLGYVRYRTRHVVDPRQIDVDDAIKRLRKARRK